MGASKAQMKMFQQCILRDFSEKNDGIWDYIQLHFTSRFSYKVNKLLLNRWFSDFDRLFRPKSTEREADRAKSLEESVTPLQQEVKEKN